MDFEAIVGARRSTRGYLDKPVTKELMAKVIDLAQRAPSSMNTQPWNFHVLTGPPLEEVRTGNTERMLAGAAIDREIKMADHGYQGIHRERQIGIAVQLFEAMGIERDDKTRRQDWVMRGFRQFDAPVSVVVTLDKELADDTIAHFDCGAATYGLVLAATSKGLGCVINGQGIMQSSVVREHGNIPEDEVIMTCVAMGWPDPDFVANDVVSRRAANEDIASYVGFED
ncbi:MAG: nitroreductase [Actinobacteria bacterium]|jgi:nitroreductase|nr:nitroreductase [Actinomycetota bacterium]MBT4303055.1 nitroreductase [Actinomycetota bacterium]MBT4477219.1 nitroreductase [Actinomycetota bacterium]MBT4655878.1 nitroreductase [Actinomycetota bacterium]MBT7868088.1 nitroreductase [Actinomycetota bacterium]